MSVWRPGITGAPAGSPHAAAPGRWWAATGRRACAGSWAWRAAYAVWPPARSGANCVIDICAAAAISSAVAVPDSSTTALHTPEELDQLCYWWNEQILVTMR